MSAVFVRARTPVRAVCESRMKRRARPGAQAAELPALPARWWAIVWPIDPYPIFCSLAQPFPNRIHENVTRFLFEFVMIPQAVIEKIALSFHAMFSGNELLPVFDSRLHPRSRGNEIIAWR